MVNTDARHQTYPLHTHTHTYTHVRFIDDTVGKKKQSRQTVIDGGLKEKELGYTKEYTILEDDMLYRLILIVMD